EGGGLSVMLPAVAGLIIGGLFAAPLAGLLVKNIRENVLLRAVGLLILLLAGYQTWQALA
ncbi:MAG TPA: sulfite exporter TauE/SafE family protein, partial [Rhizobiaceae bacterium]|nr:sulfite exporter TauE/SafE family protein [Rhizobiaceae bacterium]